MNEETSKVAIALADQHAEVVTKVNVPLDRVAYTLCAALEGGSTYWCHKVTVQNYLGHEWAHEAIAAGSPFLLRHDEDEVELIYNNQARIAEVLSLMAEKWPQHFGDLVGETEDAETGDILFQLLCFNEIVYG